MSGEVARAKDGWMDGWMEEEEEEEAESFATRPLTISRDDDGDEKLSYKRLSIGDV